MLFTKNTHFRFNKEKCKIFFINLFKIEEILNILLN